MYCFFIRAFRHMLRRRFTDRSAVVKASVYHEAISDWLVPWYHYIPMNYDYSDLYSILMYFMGKPELGQKAHDEELKAIADRSRDWAESQIGWEQQRVGQSGAQGRADFRRICIDCV